MVKQLILILWLTIAGLGQNAHGQNSVLSSGTWIKLAVDTDGIYKITYTDLQAYGLDPSGIDPATIRIFGNGGGMLPQANSTPRPVDLLELAIVVSGESDGSFDANDYILFFGEGPDFVAFDSLAQVFNYQNHLFTTTNYYFLNVNQQAGKRLASNAPQPAGNVRNAAYQVYTHQQELLNVLHSGRRWFGEKFDLEITQSFNTGVSNLAPGSEIKVVSAVMSTSLQPATFRVQLNGVTIGAQPINANPEGTYATKGTVALDTFVVNKALIDDSPLTVTYTFDKEFGIGYLDYFLLQSQNILRYNDRPLLFYTGDMANNGNVTFTIGNCPPGLELWDITDHNNTLAINYSQTGSTIGFNATYANKKFILFDPAAGQNSPTLVHAVVNQNLHAASPTDLLIITPEVFLTQANTIAGLRGAEGLSVKVATTEQVFNEFSSGMPDITAIRDYAKYLYDNAGLQHLLLFGKGTYDPKDIAGSGFNMVPIYQSRNSLQPLATYGSDDYLAFLEDDEGEWAEKPGAGHTLDIGVGRIPATTVAEADNFVNKLIAYTAMQALGPWRKDVLFVAENGDQNIHQRDAERLATLIDTTYAGFNTNKIYIDAYPIIVNPANKRAPLVNKAIYDAIHQGILIINYTGHGNEIQWAKTRVFDKNVVDTLANDTFLPLFVTATCEFGRHDDTGARSGGEDLMVKNITGAIATITTSRPVFSSSNYQLNLAFYQQVFERPNGDFQRLGDIFRHTKNNSQNGVLNRNFSLLGDPSMRLSYPRQPVTLDSLNGQPVSSLDTLNSLERLTFVGHIRQANKAIDASFNGELEVTILDQTTTRQTLGNLGGNPFTYKVRDNFFYRGTVSVTNGRFSFTAVLPKDISYNPGRGKITFYAQQQGSTLDAGGANIDFLIGRSTNNPITDNTPPEIALYLGDTNYIAGRVVNPNTLLIARLRDENGINTSINQVGHSITYTLDKNEPVVLNEFYTAAKDNFAEGWVYYNLPVMSPGRHTISFTAWDTSNNPNTATLVFTVSANNEIVITEVSNYPNPMRESTTFSFAHNLAGEDIDVTVEIINTQGQKVYRQTRSYLSAPSVINDWQWDGRNPTGGKLNTGIYIYGITLRSTGSNLTQTHYSRLFITN